jgi:cold shock CspA family protein
MSQPTNNGHSNGARLTGEVVWFDDGKGYGFIRPDDGGPDVYVHYTGIESQDKRRRLLPQQRVEFEVVQRPKGPLGTNVKVLGG